MAVASSGFDSTTRPMLFCSACSYLNPSDFQTLLFLCWFFHFSSRNCDTVLTVWFKMDHHVFSWESIGLVHTWVSSQPIDVPIFHLTPAKLVSVKNLLYKSAHVNGAFSRREACGWIFLSDVEPCWRCCRHIILWTRGVLRLWPLAMWLQRHFMLFSPTVEREWVH